MLSVHVAKELRKELRQLEAIRDTATRRIEAIQFLLDGGPIGREDRLPPHGSPVRDNASHRGPSLRATVVKALAQVSSSTAIALSQRLEAEGFRVGGTTSLRERVAHELSRLRRKGMVRRTRNGHYALCNVNGSAHSPTTVAAQSEDFVAG